MLSFIEIISSIIGIYGFFGQNITCLIIGLIAIIICDCIDIFVLGHNATTIWLAILLAIGASIASRNPLYMFTICLCGENFIMSFGTLILMIIMFVKSNKIKHKFNNK